jgi:endonuclease YncB( thermonuclease family)
VTFCPTGNEALTEACSATTQLADSAFNRLNLLQGDDMGRATKCLALSLIQVAILGYLSQRVNAQYAPSIKGASPSTSFEAKVTSVPDGLTLVVQTSNRKLRVRLAGIKLLTLPRELPQKSRKNLSQLADGKLVTVLPIEGLATEELVTGKVLLNGQDLALEQIRRGLAWAAPTQTRLLSEGDAKVYDEGQKKAEKAKLGMWEDGFECKPDPTYKSSFPAQTVSPSEGDSKRPHRLVIVEIVVNERGFVISAIPLCGHPLFREAAQEAALKATFSPTKVGGMPVRVQGTILYKLVLDD